MGYAEGFAVQGKFEDAAKWLRWAMQSTTARKLEDARYNLGQFWSALEGLKKAATGPRDWGDILTLDSQSKYALGIFYQAQQAELLKQQNNLDPALNLAAMTSPGTGLAIKAGTVGAIQGQIATLGESARRAFAEQASLAKQAESAYKSAGVKEHQAANAAHVGDYSAKGAPVDTANALRLSRSIAEPPALPNPLEFLTGSWLGIPVWAWIAGAVGVAVILGTQGPRIVAVNAARSLAGQGAN